MKKLSLNLGSFMGMRIKVHAVFVLMLMLYAVANLLIEALLVFAIVLFHELGHVLAARGYGITVKEIELLPIGGVARLEDLMSIDPHVETAVAVAGPINNVLLIACALFFRSFLDLPPDRVNFFLQANLLIMAFNLLPALPLDGGRIYRAVMTTKVGFRIATEKAAHLGQVTSALFFVSCLFMAFIGHLNLVLLITAFYLYQMAGKEQNMAVYSLISYLGRKQDDLRRQKCLPVEQLVAHRTTPIKEVIRHFVPNRYHLIYVIDDERILCQIHESELIQTMLTRGIDIAIGDIDKR